MKVCSATIPNTLKQKRRKTHQVKPTSIIPESSYDLNTLNKNRRCARTWLSLCANAIWCVLETRTLEERRRPSHASASGGWRGDTACWNSVLKWGRKGKMRWRPSQLHWSDPPILTRTRRQPHDKHTRRRQVVIFLQKNLSGDEYQRCQGVPCAAGDTPTLWGEETYARSALMQLFWFILKEQNIDLIKHFSRGEMGVHVTTSKRLIEYILWQLLEEQMRAGEGTLSNYLKQIFLKITVLKMTNSYVPVLTYWHLGHLFCCQIVALDNLVLEQRQTAYLLGFIAVLKTKHENVFFFSLLHPFTMERKEKSQTQLCCLLGNVFYSVINASLHQTYKWRNACLAEMYLFPIMGRTATIKRRSSQQLQIPIHTNKTLVCLV